MTSERPEFKIFKIQRNYKREFFYNCLDGSLLSKNKYAKEIVLEFTVLENHNILKNFHIAH